MASLAGALLVLSLVGLAWFMRDDAKVYAAFKTLTDTRERQKSFRSWVTKAFLTFFVGAVVALAVLGRLVDLLREPAEFTPLSEQVHAFVPQAVMGALAPGMMAGAIVGAIGFALVARVAGRRGGQAMMLGDIEPMMPRNASEAVWVCLLSLNAGIGEEMFFRLLVPLLIVLVTGNVWLAFCGAAIVFGFVHLYQGWTGILATTFAGLLYSGIYLWTTSLLVVMAVHAGMNILNLVVRPALGKLAVPR